MNAITDPSYDTAFKLINFKKRKEKAFAYNRSYIPLYCVS